MNDCNVCLHSITWYENDAWEEEGLPKALKAGFVNTATGMSVYCKMNKQFYSPDHYCEKWGDIKEDKKIQEI